MSEQKKKKPVLELGMRANRYHLSYCDVPKDRWEEIFGKKEEKEDDDDEE